MLLRTPEIYAFTLSGLLILFLALTYLSPIILRWLGPLRLFTTKLLTYTFVVRRHRWILLSPWTVAATVLQSAYIAGNLASLLLPVPSLPDTALRAGQLALINLMPLLLSPHLGFLADRFGISRRRFGRIHGSIGVMTCALTIVHGGIMVHSSKQRDLYTIMGAFLSLPLLIIGFVPFLRSALYETALRIHQILALFMVSAIYRHLQSISGVAWIYIYIYASLVCGINSIYLGVTLYRNIAWGKPFTRALLRQHGLSTSITVDLPRPLRLDAGQYINLWIWVPKVSKWSWMQSHPFVVTSWLPREQSTLELFVQHRGGLTSKLTRIKVNDSVRCLAFISGPHGIVVPVWEAKSVIMVAMDFAIAAMLPYLAKLVHGYRTFASRTRRIHLVWHVQRLLPFVTVLDLLNKYLKDDETLAKVLGISVYNDIGSQEEHLGSHGQVKYFIGAPDLKKVLEAEKNGDFIKYAKPVELPAANLREDYLNLNEGSLINKNDTESLLQDIQRFQADDGKILVLVAGTDLLRDKLRQWVGDYGQGDVELKELDYQL